MMHFSAPATLKTFTFLLRSDAVRQRSKGPIGGAGAISSAAGECDRQ